MTFTPKLLEEYRECERALKEAGNLLQTENPDAAVLSRLEGILSADNDAMAMLRKHREYGQRLPVVLETIKEIMKKCAPTCRPSEPGIVGGCVVEPVSDAEMVVGNWAQCVSGCKAKSLEIATLKELAELRIKHGKDSIYCKNGGWVAENFNYLPNGDILVASRDYNPHFKYAEEATKAHIAGKEFYLDDKIVEGLLEGVKQGGVLLWRRTEVADKISVYSFGKEPLTAFLGWNQDYAEFLSKNEITEIRLYTAKKESKAFSRALWAVNLDCNSALGGDGSLYYDYGRAFGVRRRGEQSETGSTGPK